MSLVRKEYVLPVPDLSSGQDGPSTIRRLHAEYWDLCVAKPWAAEVAAYEASPDDVCHAWYYLDGHPAFWRFREPPLLAGVPQDHVSLLEHSHAFQRGLVEIAPHKVNPATGCQEDEERLNTHLEWWYEFGPHDLLPRDEGHGILVQGTWHDWPLDGHAVTYEGALTDIARKVWTHYGNDRTIVDTDEWRNGDRAYRPPAW